ncbi:hypothetical protein [uncultured Pelagimonas sp.]|uniref:hypothetical protein n=1 Tax=uncultured Pelagimonas sp. TaxID=1618102 RepID=UPI0026356F46|nr:hypothetical protein [uncultured Pelagimonas sp.]
MGIIKSVRLIKPAGRNLVCEIELIDASAGFLVNYRYGWAGSSQTEGTRTEDAVPLDQAQRIFDSLVLSYKKRGYYEDSGQGAAPHGAPVDVGQTDTYSARLLSRLEHLPGLNDQDAARLIWSLSQRRVTQALPRLIDLAPLRDGAARRLLPYAIWRLGEALWSEDALEQIRNLAQSSDAPCAEAARLVLAQMLGDADAAGFTADADLRSYLDQSSPSEDSAAAFLRHVVQARKGDEGPRRLLTAYAWSCQSDVARGNFLMLLQIVPLQPGVFRAIRRVFKAAEAFDDAEVYGVLADRFATQGQNKSPGYVYSRSTRQYIPYRDAVVTDGRQYAYSRRTRQYLNKRIWRNLRGLGGYRHEAFTSMASAVLVSATERTSSAIALNEILSDTRGFEPQWLAVPNQSLTVLQDANLDDVAVFAANLLRKDDAFCVGMSEQNLTSLLYDTSQIRQDFATHAFKLQVESGQLTAKKLRLLAGASGQEAQRLAQLAFQLAPERWATPTEDLAALLLAFLPDAHEWLRDALPKSRVDGDTLIEAVLAQVQTLPKHEDPAKGPVFDMAKASALAQTLGARYKSAVMACAPEVFQALSENENDAVQLFALRLAAIRPDGISLFDAQALAGSDWPELQETAAALLAGADVAVLKNAVPLVVELLVHGSAGTREQARQAVVRLVRSGGEGERDITLAVLHEAYQTDLDDEVQEELVALFGARARVVFDVATDASRNMRKTVARQGVEVIWSLIRARSATARRIGAVALGEMSAHDFSLRKLARIGACDQKIARDWAVSGLESRRGEVAETPREIFALLDCDWDDSREAAYAMIRAQGTENWPPDAIISLCDCNSLPAQGFGRELMTRAMSPENAPAFLSGLAEHPGKSFQLTLARLVREHAGQDAARFRTLEPALRRILMRPHASRPAKEQIWRYFEELLTTGPADLHARLFGLLEDISASITRTDRDRAVSLLVQLRRHAPDLVGETVGRSIVQGGR